MSIQEKAVAAITMAAADNGRIIEVGFDALRELAIAPDAPQAQIDEMRIAYMAGAQHVWASIMSILDHGDDETPGDLMRMAKMQAELDAWRQTLELRLGKTDGAA